MTAPEAVLPGRRAPTGLRAWRELLVGLAVFALYALVVMLPEDARRAAARRHADTLYGWERALRIDVEHALNGWLAHQPVLRVLANYEYAVTYIASALGLLVWLYLRHPDRYRTARNTFVVLNLLALACFTLYPLMPPRLMPDLGFVDTVRLGRTWGSWGSPLVENADQLAAMPSLHMAWTLWVGVELAKTSALRSVQVLNALHILLTGYVIMATANHYVLDAVAAVPLVALSVCTVRRTRGARAERVAATDAFFLAVETPRAPQHVGGVMVLDTSRTPVGRADVVRLVLDRLDRVPRFRQRLVTPSRLRRPVWEDHPVIDWDWHVVERDVTGRGMTGLRAVVAELQSEALPRDRPLWRMVVVQGVAPDRTAVVFLMHHVVADGIGVVAQALLLMDAPPARADRGGRRPGPAARAAATAVGFAQLAADTPPRTRLPVGGTAERRFGTTTLPLPLMRDVARRHGARVTDVVLCAVAGAVHRVARDADPAARDALCRFAVPLMMRSPEDGAEGNHTTAVMVDLPIGALPENERLARIARRCRGRRTGTRAQAAWFVMRDVARLMPAPLHRRFARAVYSPRFLQGVVSNMPGPVTPPVLSGAPLDEVYPVIPLVPGAPLAVGALSIAGVLCVGVSADPRLADDADRFVGAMRDVVDELRRGGAA
ncbi:bifunctional phosphatase PAP2/O-acyltransferase family protein [Actinomadura atramentaria]|uniref:bifunctional phosphatase PAP2/O-acyltransferase family protein n=1 Tax=Actinomadura atramentaria TaxID=1990 RepID=UPI00036A6D09|nr:phosphatase PAP2 family protein [Actinomadura atramentaria]